MGAYDAAGLEKMGAHGLGASRDEGAALSGMSPNLNLFLLLSLSLLLF